MSVIRLFGFEVGGWILSDSSSALSLLQPKGVGQQHHIEASYLWIQDHEQFHCGAVCNRNNSQNINHAVEIVKVY